jgi:hypothetical protein
VTAVTAIVAWSRQGRIVKRLAGALVLVAWSIVFLAPTVRAVSRTLSATTPSAGPEVGDELVRYVRQLPTGSVILTDPRTAYALSALSEHRFVAVHGQHGNPLDAHALDRLEAVRDVLSPHVVSQRAAAACDRYGVDFVICNAVSRTHRQEFLSTWDSSDYMLTVTKLDAIAGRFRAVHEAGDFTVFLHDFGGAGGTTWGPSQAPFEFESDREMGACRVEAPGGAFRIVSAAMSTPRAVPGEPVQITLGYERSRATRYELPFTIHLRLDHESVGRAGDYPGSKHVRRAGERWGRYAVRFTRPHTPLGGRFEVDMWPIGKRFYETFEIDLPWHLRPGTYSLMLTIERASLVPSHSFRDLLYNRDRKSGEVCATLEVTSQRVRAP